MAKDAVGRTAPHTLVRALRAVPDFASLPDPSLLCIVGASANLFWPAGRSVFEAGSESEGLYIVLSGRVRIVDVVEGERVEVAVIGPGDFFGELSLVLHTAHSRSAETMEDTELMVVPTDSFQALLSSDKSLAEKLRHKIEERLPPRRQEGGQSRA